MPLTYTAELFQALYNVGGPDGRRLTYRRELYDLDHGWIGRRLALLPPGLITAARVAVVGCGFGWLLDHLVAAGAAEVVGIDPSPHIAAHKATDSTDPSRIVAATVGVDNVRSVLQAAGFSRTYTVVIDEDAASSHADAELSAFFDGCEQLLQGGQLARIIHLVTPRVPESIQDSAINWKTLAEWKALRPAHTWINILTGEIA